MLSEVRFIQQSQSGLISLYHKNDDKLLINISHPFCIGLTGVFHEDSKYYMKSDTEVSFLVKSNAEVVNALDNLNLWKECFQVISFVIDVYESIHLSNSININNYNIIKKSLEQIWALPEDIRKNTSIFKYIMERHPISRSSVSKIISALNEGGYISTKRAILTNVNKIPSRY
ncbi:helix-turn-helix domain-containing protein [Buttiauxella warmboldiae]|uniref:helix-turn-helix domain-containing protein n=1 Tax=Buttiauxella warmboldiae TaxID=82993 RepID=UPI00142E81DD|nr:helix-turn-helix domain-containing protein [Buttiauxella warmboldiae]